MRWAWLLIAVGIAWLGPSKTSSFAQEPILNEAIPAYPPQWVPGQSCADCQGSEARHPVGHWWKNPIGCWASLGSPGCGSLKSECIFLFGSCRQFFGQPCLKEPPPALPYPYSAMAPACSRP
jgi:hypothetical protein